MRRREEEKNYTIWLALGSNSCFWIKWNVWTNNLGATDGFYCLTKCFCYRLISLDYDRLFTFYFDLSRTLSSSSITHVWVCVENIRIYILKNEWFVFNKLYRRQNTSFISFNIHLHMYESCSIRANIPKFFPGLRK